MTLKLCMCWYWQLRDFCHKIFILYSVEFLLKWKLYLFARYTANSYIRSSFIRSQCRWHQNFDLQLCCCCSFFSVWQLFSQHIYLKFICLFKIRNLCAQIYRKTHIMTVSFSYLFSVRKVHYKLNALSFLLVSRQAVTLIVLMWRIGWAHNNASK